MAYLGTRAHSVGAALAAIVLLGASAPAHDTAEITEAAIRCAYQKGINKIGVTVVRQDGDTAIVEYDMGDAGSGTTFLVYRDELWRCSNTSGGVPGATTLKNVQTDLQKNGVKRSTSQLQQLLIGRRGKTLLKTARPKVVQTRPHPPRL